MPDDYDDCDGCYSCEHDYNVYYVVVSETTEKKKLISEYKYTYGPYDTIDIAHKAYAALIGDAKPERFCFGKTRHKRTYVLKSVFEDYTGNTENEITTTTMYVSDLHKVG